MVDAQRHGAASVQVCPFAPEDLEQLELTEAALAVLGRDEWRPMLRAAAAAGPAWTGRLEDRVIGVAGIALHWRGRAAAWCMLGRDIPKAAWLSIHRAVAARLAQADALGVRRIEAETQFGYPPGVRWLLMLGFECEGAMRQYGPNGEDFLRFARILPEARA